jgi:hypothetical protein
MHEEAPASGGWLKPGYRIGEVARPLKPLPETLTTATVGVLRVGEIDERSLPVSDGSFAFVDTGEAGAIRFGIGEDWSYAAINLADSAESRIAPVTAAADAAATLHLSRRFLGSMPWIGLTVLALLVVSLEWLTYHFRWTE